MTTVWAICGAGRGVGKTTLALKLSQMLPDCRYAKCGRGRSKPEKPGAFFTNLHELERFIDEHRDRCCHLVVESNAYARTGNADMTIFIDGVEGKTDFREDTDRLKARADIAICRDARPREWDKKLSGTIDGKTLRKKIGEALIRQHHYLFGAEPEIRSKIWFESAGRHVFGMGLSHLLEHVERLGTLQAAAKASRMSYRYAWNLIDDAERRLGESLILRKAGGAAGGASELSDAGRKMLVAFRQINQEVCDYANTCFKRFYPEADIEKRTQDSQREQKLSDGHLNEQQRPAH